MPTTPNMGLTEPTVSVTTGPQWATLLNALIDLIDAHDHSTGKGARVPAAGLNVNGDLAFNTHKATDLTGLVFAQVAITDNGALFAGSDGELYYRNGAGVLLQLTTGGQLNLAAAGIAADLNMNAFRLTNVGSMLLINSGGAIAAALALYIQTVSSIARLRWNDANGTVLDLASAYAVDPPVVTTVAGNVSLSFSGNDQLILVDTTASRTITLFSPANFKKTLRFVDIKGQAQTNPFTIARFGTEKIAGLTASKSYQTNWGSIDLVTDGTDWYIQ